MYIWFRNWEFLILCVPKPMYYTENLSVSPVNIYIYIYVYIYEARTVSFICIPSGILFHTVPTEGSYFLQKALFFLLCLCFFFFAGKVEWMNRFPSLGHARIYTVTSLLFQEWFSVFIHFFFATRRRDEYSKFRSYSGQQNCSVQPFRT
jgi:hypothetical protein